jgi:protein Mpv17
MSAVFAISQAFIRQPKRLWGKYLDVLERKPVQTKISTSVAAAFLGDMIAQGLSSNSERFRPDLARTARLCIFNGGMGLFGHFYFAALDKGVVLGAATKAATQVATKKYTPNLLLTSLSKTFIDQGIFAPMATMMFYLFKVSSEGRPFEFLDEMKLKYIPTLQAGWQLWVPCHILNFMFIPPQHRVLYTNIVSVAGTYVLSRAASNDSAQSVSARKKGRGDDECMNDDRPNEVLFDFGAVNVK